MRKDAQVTGALTGPWATAVSHANIALVKVWGMRGAALCLPALLRPHR